MALGDKFTSISACTTWKNILRLLKKQTMHDRLVNTETLRAPSHSNHEFYSSP